MTRNHEYAPMTNTPVMRGMQASLDNSIICGDCGDKMRQHMPNESVDLIYMDPPFFSGKNYEVIWKDGAEVRSFTDTDFYTLECKCGKTFPENYKFCPICGAGKDEATERRSTDIEAYLQWLRPKLEQCYRMLKQTGSIYVHLDWHAVHYVKVMLDEIFGMKRFRNEIAWSYNTRTMSSQWYARKHDSILFYTKSDTHTFNADDVRVPHREESVRQYNKVDEDGNRYKPQSGNKRTYLDERGQNCGDVWDIQILGSRDKERLGYPTQKPEALLKRIIKASSNPGDLVLDPFCGCGTAVAVAQKLGRRWIGIDVSPTSCKAMSSRLHKIGYPINETGIDVIDMPQTNDQLRNMDDFEFQNWAVTQLGGRQVVRKSGDRGVDGFTFVGDTIQVKNSEKIGAPDVRKFVYDTMNFDKTHGVFVAHSYSSGAQKEVDIASAKHGIDIELLTVADLVK